MPKRPSAKRRQEVASLGGKARAAKLSAKRRKQIARDAAKSRWGRHELRTEALDISPEQYIYVGPKAVYVRPVEAPNA